MAVIQSNQATGLHLAWAGPVRGAGPAHQQLAVVVRDEINAGRLRSGERMPPSRGLAEELGLSRWVVTEAYDQLIAEGYLTARVGSGTVVAVTVTSTGAGSGTSSTGTSTGTASATSTIAGTGTGTDTGPDPGRSRPAVRSGTAMLDLSPALPDVASFPRTLWRLALTRALEQATDAELAYPDPLGAIRLRETMAGYLRRVRAIDADPGRVLVSQGVGTAVGELCRYLRTAGARRVAVEDPTWPRLREIAVRHSLQVISIPVEDGGMAVDELVRLDRRNPIDAVFTMPTHQFPTGVALSADRRLALLDWARARARWIIEDDYDAEFRYDRRPVGALAALAPDRVVYLGSVSKTLSPSLHLGWMVVPDRLRPGLDAARSGLGALAPGLDQLALADLVDSGRYDRHLRRMRRRYRDRREALLAALGAARMPGDPAPSMEAGLHVVWHLPPDIDEEIVVRRCRAAGLEVLGLARCRASPGPPGLVLGYANLPPHRATEVAAVIADSAAVTPDSSVRPPRSGVRTGSGRQRGGDRSVPPADDRTPDRAAPGSPWRTRRGPPPP